jgi:hypothetical protein
MRRFWQKQSVVSMEGDLSERAVGNTPVKTAKNSLQGMMASNQRKNSYKRNASLSENIIT